MKKKKPIKDNIRSVVDFYAAQKTRHQEKEMNSIIPREVNCHVLFSRTHLAAFHIYLCRVHNSA